MRETLKTYAQMAVGDSRPAHCNSTEDTLYGHLQEVREVSGAQFRVHEQDDFKPPIVTRVR